MLGFFVLSLHNLPLCHQGKINTKYAVISSKQLTWAAEIVYNAVYNLANYRSQCTVLLTTHNFTCSLNFPRICIVCMPFVAVCGEDELKWKFKPDTLTFCLLRIFLQLSWKTRKALVGTRSLSAKGSLCRMFSFELSEQKLKWLLRNKT